LYRLLSKAGIGVSLVLACSLAVGAFIYLALIPPTSLPWWRMGGVFAIGCGAGLLDSALFQGITPMYRHEASATANLAATFFGLGCVLIAILVAGTFEIYTVPSILIFIALIPGFFIPAYARSSYPRELSSLRFSLRQRASDFRSPSAVLFSLLLFFQFGNEWAIAGWLPLFLVHRLGVSPETSLMLLALYWLALLVGRTVVLSVMPAVHHGKLLMASVLAAILGCMILISTNNRFGAVTGILLIGGGFASVYPLVLEKIGRRFPDYHPGFYNGIFSLAITGGMLAPWSLGYFAHLWGIRIVMGLPLLGTMMVCLLLMVIWAEGKFRDSAGLK
jgi:fucose permease